MISNKWLNLLAGIALILGGLGLLGLIEGWSGTESLVSKIFGVAFIITGVLFFYKIAVKKHTK